MRCLVVFALIAVFCLSAGSASWAQVAKSKASEQIDSNEPSVLWESKELIDPATFGMQPISDPSRLYSLLTGKGRCVVRKPEQERIPCALISYAPASVSPEDYANSLRPIFKIDGQGEVWTFIGGQLAKASADELREARDLFDGPDRVANGYPATAIVGYRENATRCVTLGKSKCLSDATFMREWASPAILTPACVEEIWRPRGGPRDPGEQSRCRYTLVPSTKPQ